MFKKVLVLILFIPFVFTSCGDPYKYLGKTYPRTLNPEMFFREADVQKEFEVMGQLEVEMPENKNMDRIQRRLLTIASDKGADAILITNFDMTTGGFTSVGAGGGKRGKKGGNISGGVSSTDVRKDIQVQAQLLKYRP
jgi:hypothetical protein